MRLQKTVTRCPRRDQVVSHVISSLYHARPGRQIAFDAGTIMIHEKFERKLAACKHAETACHAQIFFLPRLLIIFLEIKYFKGPRGCPHDKAQAFIDACSADGARPRVVGAICFSRSSGRSNLWRFRGGIRPRCRTESLAEGNPARASANICTRIGFKHSRDKG
jgi:hypothetical protein